MDSSGVQYNASVIVKLKKLYNNVRKHYELNLFKAFLMIDKYGRSSDRGDKTRTKSPEPTKQIAPPAPVAPVVQSSQ